MKRIIFGVWCLLLLGVVSPVSASQFESKKVVVRSGDNLGKIAERYRVSLKDLRRWNRRKIGVGDRIRIGDVLTLRVKRKGREVVAEKPSWIGHYRVRSGDSLGVIARRLGVTVGHLTTLNRLRSTDIIRQGQTLQYEKPGERPASSSTGRPTRGKLAHGRHLGKGVGYRLRFPKNAYGVEPVNKILRRCARQVAVRFPGSAKLLIGDISRPTGGHFPPHSSHQSGRDADVGYYLGGNLQNKTLHLVAPSHLDYAKNWTLLRCYLKSGEVVRIYMDRKIQKGYVRFLRRKRIVDAATIDRLFGAVAPNPHRALIRHSKGHDTHLHVRFRCAPDAVGCEEEKQDKLFHL